MKFRNIIVLVLLLFLVGCDQYVKKNKSSLIFKPDKKYKNIGFTLIYNEDLNLKKLDQRSLQIFHKTLKAKSQVKITNPLNNKSLIAEIKSNRVKYSNFYNSIITNRIAETLEIDPSEPYIEIVLISEDSTFIANKAKTFEEEKEVAQKAPIDGIQISDLSGITKNKSKKQSNQKFSYSIKVADFYYKKSANIMIDRIKNETTIVKIKLIELSKTNYRVLLGPFNDIDTLIESFEKMDSFNFENLEILKNV
tara:strand:- start:3608 stop:4360 length:753 start_codon:yes stop_codon:yes gene_type:complete